MNTEVKKCSNLTMFLVILFCTPLALIIAMWLAGLTLPMAVLAGLFFYFRK